MNILLVFCLLLGAVSMIDAQTDINSIIKKVTEQINKKILREIDDNNEFKPNFKKMTKYFQENLDARIMLRQGSMKKKMKVIFFGALKAGFMKEKIWKNIKKMFKIQFKTMVLKDMAKGILGGKPKATLNSVRRALKKGFKKSKGKSKQKKHLLEAFNGIEKAFKKPFLSKQMLAFVVKMIPEE